MIKFFIEPGYDVKKPEREAGNSGIDFFIPNETKAFMEAFKAKNEPELAYIYTNNHGDRVIHIAAHGRVNIPSGVRSRIEPNVALEAHNKSGVATKLGLVFGASTVDPSYQGVIHISLINTNTKPIEIPLGMKAVQFVPRIVDITPIEVYENTTFEEFYSDFEFSNRGEGAFGSTGV
jgi:dUTPase